MLVDDINPGVFGSNQEMEMRVAVWQASIERNVQGELCFGILDW